MRNKLFIGTVAAGLSFIVIIALAQTYPAGMISYWKAEDNAVDTVGNNHGTSMINTTFATGQVGRAFSFSANYSSVSIPHSQSLELSDAITVMAWAKPSRMESPYNSYDRMISKGTRANVASWSIWFSKTSLTPNFFVGYIGPKGDEIINCPMMGTIPRDEWSHIVGTYDRQKIRLYINGILNNEEEHTYPIRPSSLPLFIGSAGNEYYFKGEIDEVAIFDRALSPEEIQWHYKNGLNGLGYEAINVFVDIKPGSCPNSLNLKSRGVLPVAILGAEYFDVCAIDPSTLRIIREGNRDEGVMPLRWSLEDVATPYEETDGGCHDLGPDGYLDLTLKFDIQELILALHLDDEEISGETLPLILIGKIRDERGGETITGSDVVSILKKGK